MLKIFLIKARVMKYKIVHLAHIYLYAHILSILSQIQSSFHNYTFNDNWKASP